MIDTNKYALAEVQMASIVEATAPLSARYLELVAELRDVMTRLSAATILAGHKVEEPLAANLPGFPVAGHPASTIAITVRPGDLAEAMEKWMEASAPRTAEIIPFARD